jgi:4-amino-4-deoxy-L-arabinose transferase-like glycosyltransferase
MKIKVNEGKLDRAIRFLIAIAVAFYAYYNFTGTLLILSYVIATILTITALTGFCGLYELLKINTVKQKS